MQQSIGHQPVGRRKRAHEVAEHLDIRDQLGRIQRRQPASIRKRPDGKIWRRAAPRFAKLSSSCNSRVRGDQEWSPGTRQRTFAQVLDRPTCRTGQARVRDRTGPDSHGADAPLVLEAGVAWQAAQQATDEDIARLKLALNANAAATGNTGEFIRTDVAFHYELTLITHNPIFAAVPIRSSNG